MAGQALYRRWRSQTFEEVVGQEHVTLTLRNALREGRMSHAYLFTGPRGTGKTSTARILAKAINCLEEDLRARPCNRCRICQAIAEGRLLDLIEIDAASNRGIDEIRDLREKIGFRPNEARFKVYIIDEVHMLTKEAFNALLKTLEEPPEHVVFVLATTEPDRVPETVRSRCQRFDFRRIPTNEIVEHLSRILQAEGARAETQALTAIARRATGSMRDAVSLLDQLLAYGDDVLTLARVENILGLVSAQTIGQLVEHIADHDTAAGLALISRLVAEGVELGEMVDQIIAYLRGVLLVRLTRSPELLDLPQDVVAIMARQARRLDAAVLLAALQEFTTARAALRDQVPGVPQLPIEVAFLRAAFSSAPAVAAQGPAAAAVGAPTAAATPAPVPAGRGAASAAAAAGSPVPTATPAPAPAGRGAASAAPGPERRTGTSVPASSLVTAGPSPSKTDDLLQGARGNWDRFLTVARRRCGVKVQAALRAVRELDVVGQALVLQFSHAFARDLVNQPDNRTAVEGAWEEVLGRRVPIRCVLMGESLADPDVSPSPTPQGNAADEDQILLEDARRRGAVVTPLET